jgi:serine/threonine protein kinase
MSLAEQRSMNCAYKLPSKPPAWPTLASELASVPPGTVLGGSYRVTGVVDIGGMGEVYAAEHLRLHRPVAIKVLARHLVGDDASRARFEREAEIVSRLQHPHVVQVLDYDLTPDKRPYLAMEMLDGCTLESRIEREGALPLSSVVDILHQAASAMMAVHQAGIIHRDLKPGNLFLVRMTAGGVCEFVKLLDFGIGKRLLAGGRRITDRQQLLGTPHYMAPEQATGEHERIDARSDQFALGVIAFEMLTGAAPFMADNVVALLGKILDEAPPPLLELAPEGTPSELAAVVERALAKNPEQRYPDVASFAAAFSRAAGYEPEPVEASSRRTPVKIAQPISTMHELIELLECARQEDRRGSRLAAARAAEKALAHSAGVSDPDAARVVELATPLLRRILVTRLGGMSQRLRLARPLSASDPIAGRSGLRRLAARRRAHPRRVPRRERPRTARGAALAGETARRGRARRRRSPQPIAIAGQARLNCILRGTAPDFITRP